MYHPGKVVGVYSEGKDIVGADKTVQATLKMWDDNLVTLLVDENIGKEIKAGDVVLVSYRPLQNIPGQAVPSMTIVKILRGEAGKKIMKEYADNKAEKKA